MKKGYESVKMRVWRYSEDIVRTSNPAEPVLVGEPGDGNPLEGTATFSEN